MVDEKFISDINIRLGTIAAINSFVNHDKTYYIAYLRKEENDVVKTLRKHFNVQSWTFSLEEVKTDWKPILKNELLWYFGHYLLHAMGPQISAEYAGKTVDEFDEINRKIILQSRTNCEHILDTFLSDIDRIVGERFAFYKLKVHWSTSEGWEQWYECFENDYVFDLGEEILFLHFGESD